MNKQILSYGDKSNALKKKKKIEIKTSRIIKSEICLKTINWLKLI